MRILILLSLVVINSLLCYAAEPVCVEKAVTATGYCAHQWAAGLKQPRGIIVLSNNDVLVVERSESQVTLLYETTQLNSVALATVSGINHGIAYGGGYLYVSSSSTVYRWAYAVGTRTALGTPETVITGIPTGGHNTRTLVYDNGTLIVSVGSDGNVDTSGQGAINRFQISSFPTTFSSRTVIASGVRNEVGLRFDPNGRLWGVENGVDSLNRADLGGDIHNQNPGEEINLFDQEGKFYGYPYCWSQYNLTTVTTPRLTQYAQPDFMNDGTHTDAWCQNTNNVVPPKFAMRAHTAPLDILFYNGGTNFPAADSVFVAQHGSWNRNPPAGYRVVKISLTSGMPTSESDFLWYQGPGETADGWIRPVGLAWYSGGNGNTRLLVTDDQTGLIVAVSYDTNCSCSSAGTTSATTSSASGSTKSATTSSSGTTKTSTSSAGTTKTSTSSAPGTTTTNAGTTSSASGATSSAGTTTASTSSAPGTTQSVTTNAGTTKTSSSPSSSTGGNPADSTTTGQNDNSAGSLFGSLFVSLFALLAAALLA